MALAHAHRRVASLLQPPPAGPYASNVAVLRESNNVGGSNINMQLPLELQKEVFDVTCKDFTGNTRQVALGTDANSQLNATVLFFEPGSIQIVGARSKSAIMLVIHRICEILRARGHSPFMLYVSIDNTVVRGNVGFKVNLARAHGALPGFDTTYSPAHFPGLVCTYQDTVRVVTFVMFESGRVMALGIQDLMPVNAIYMQLIAMSHQFAADPVAGPRRAQPRVDRTRVDQDRAIAKAISAAVRNRQIADPALVTSEELLQQLATIASTARRGVKRTATAY